MKSYMYKARFANTEAGAFFSSILIGSTVFHYPFLNCVQQVDLLFILAVPITLSRYVCHALR